MGILKDLAGEKFGLLRVLEREGSNKHGQATWLCRCDCGNLTTVITGSLNSGRSKSCGCLQPIIAQKNQTTHGLSDHPLYQVYHCMKKRCEKASSTGFEYYGGRGISVCDSWKSDFKKFYDWSMENGWEKGLHLHRIYPNKGYTPNNCVWLLREYHRKIHAILNRRVAA